MSEIANLKHINKIVTNKFPRLNNQYLIETSIESTYVDKFYPVNSFEQDLFIEFRIPKTLGVFTDLSNIHIQFQLQVKKQIGASGNWSPRVKTAVGDHYDIANSSAYSIFKHATLDFNNVQVQNIDNYSLNSYIKLITNFPSEEYLKLGKLLHLENYEEIKEELADDTYFENLEQNSPIYKRLLELRNNGVFLRAPLLLDVTKISSYLLDGIDFIIRINLHDPSFVFHTFQYKPSASSGLKFYYELSEVSLHVKRIKPSQNSYNALQKSLLPQNNNTPSIDYPFVSQLSKQYHIPQGLDQYIIDLPFSNRIPEKIFLAFQTHKAFNTRDYKTNGLYLSHLNLKNIFITINSSTVFNINCDFTKKDVAELYHTLLSCLDENHLITLDKFCNGGTLLGFPLTNSNEESSISSPIYGVLRIVLTFDRALSQSAVIYLLGDVLSVLSVNYNRDIFLNKS